MSKNDKVSKLAKHLRTWKTDGTFRGGRYQDGQRYTFRGCAEKIIANPQAHLDALVAAGVLYTHLKHRGANRSDVVVYNTHPTVYPRSPAEVAEDRLQAIYNVNEEMADTEFAGSQTNIYITGTMDPEEVRRIVREELSEGAAAYAAHYGSLA